MYIQECIRGAYTKALLAYTICNDKNVLPHSRQETQLHCYCERHLVYVYYMEYDLVQCVE